MTEDENAAKLWPTSTPRSLVASKSFGRQLVARLSIVYDCAGESDFMDRIVECVPNFSEGRRRATIERIVAAIESVAGALVLDVHADADHNRSVVTFVAPPETVVEAAVRAVACAKELIDLREHTGLHPRIGATDVVPFVPLRNVSMEECVRLAHEAGARIWDELAIPVYFYERAALRADRTNLEDVRRGGFEKLRELVRSDEKRAPDIGEAKLHETAGACIVGARPILIAFNVHLRTDDPQVAARIARAVRGRDGGLRFLKALGFKLETRGMAQVSMNLTNYERTTLHHAFEAVRREAERYGVAIAGSEVVGLVPQAALDEAAAYWLRLETTPSAAVLEKRLAAALRERDSMASGPKPLATLVETLREQLRELSSEKALTAREALEELDAVSAQLAATVRQARFERARSVAREAALKSSANLLLESIRLAVQALATTEIAVEELLDAKQALLALRAADIAQVAFALASVARSGVLQNAAHLDDEETAEEYRARANELFSQARETAARITEMSQLDRS